MNDMALAIAPVQGCELPPWRNPMAEAGYAYMRRRRAEERLQRIKAKQKLVEYQQEYNAYLRRTKRNSNRSNRRSNR